MKTYSQPVGGAVIAPVTQVNINVRALRQEILKQIDSLPPSKWERGVRFSTTGAPVVIARDERSLTVSYRGKNLARVRVSPGKDNKLQPDSKTRTAVEKALTAILQKEPEAAQIMANQV